MKKRHHAKLVHEGSYVAEVDVELRPEQLDPAGWRRLARLLPRKEKP